MLSSAGALAAGEMLAASYPELSGAYPLALSAALAVMLFGYAFSWPFWREVVIFLAGIALFFAASVDSELLYREKPWMRGRVRRNASPAKVLPLADALREDFSRRIAIGLDEDRLSVALSRAILLGERSRMPPDIKRVFVEAGTIHIFAISGLHVMAVATVLTALAAMAQMPYRWCGAAALPFLWGYVAMIGFPPSAVRAAAMASINFLAPVFRRRPDSLVAWSLTFVLVHAISPAMIEDVGCRLSFAVMLGIILVLELMSGKVEGWRSGLCVSLAAWTAGFPIAAAVFARVTPGGLLANIVLLPTAGAAVWTGIAGILASYISENLASHLNNLSSLLVDAMVAVSQAVSSLPGSSFEITAVSPWSAAAMYLAVLLPPAWWRWRRRRTLFKK